MYDFGMEARIQSRVLRVRKKGYKKSVPEYAVNSYGINRALNLKGVRIATSITFWQGVDGGGSGLALLGLWRGFCFCSLGLLFSGAFPQGIGVLVGLDQGGHEG